MKELTRAVTDLGFCGAMVNGYSNLGTEKLYLDEDRFEPFWTALEELRVPLYLHPRLPARAVQDAIYRGHPELVGAFEYNPYSQRTRKRLQDYLSDNIWVTTSGNFNDQALITTLLAVGADHIMFASDYPYDMATDAARWIETAPISENDRRKICYANAAALFGLPR